MTRLIPLLLLALAVVALLAYARLEREADAEWAATCAKIEIEVRK